jgi:hypothetical protein
MDGLDQQVYQVVGQATGTQIHKGRQPGDARSVKMSAQVAWHFDRYAPPAALEVARRSTVKQITGKNRRIAATP